MAVLLDELLKEYDARKARMAPVAFRTADLTTVERIHFEQVTFHNKFSNRQRIN